MAIVYQSRPARTHGNHTRRRRMRHGGEGSKGSVRVQVGQTQPVRKHEKKKQQLRDPDQVRVRHRLHASSHPTQAKQPGQPQPLEGLNRRGRGVRSFRNAQDAETHSGSGV
eukprot:1240912-Prymnesium_polylepis.1